MGEGASESGEEEEGRARGSRAEGEHGAAIRLPVRASKGNAGATAVRCVTPVSMSLARAIHHANRPKGPTGSVVWTSDKSNDHRAECTKNRNARQSYAEFAALTPRCGQESSVMTTHVQMRYMGLDPTRIASGHRMRRVSVAVQIDSSRRMYAGRGSVPTAVRNRPTADHVER